jgi:stage IV sporulation protein FB
MRHNAGMLLAEPQPTPADLRFSLAGIPVRVSLWFWLASALFGWNICRLLSAGDQRELLRYLVMWIGASFVSILLHEMGHALAYRFFGQATQVVLFHFGGLTVPLLWGRRGRRSPGAGFLVSAAGPVAQLALALLLVIGLRAAGYAIPFPLPEIGDRLGFAEGRLIESRFVFALVWFLLQINIFWPIFNLMPVPPLDGGQMVRDGLLVVGVDDAVRIANVVGVGVGGLVAWWAYTRGEPYVGIMFAMLAVSCFQSVSDGGRWR